MSTHDIRDATRPDYDPLLQTLADYVVDYDVTQSREAMETARWCLADSIGCALLALNYPACTRLLGPVVPGASLAGGARVPGTSYELDPVRAAFNIGAMIRWLDFNDTWLAAEWGHPSDNLGGILAVADYLGRKSVAEGRAPLTMRAVLEAAIQAHEIQGVLALENGFNRVGLDHVLLVRVATAAVVTRLLGGSRGEILNALSNAWIDGSSLRTYRHAPNTGSRKSWAAGDASARGVWLALTARRGEMGYPSALSTKTWGFQDVSFRGQPLKLARPLGSYVMENVLFKISYPAEFHAQTAVEAGARLHPQVHDRIGDIERIEIATQESAIRIIDKTGPLANPADRDHCLQYMTAIALLKGDLTAGDYEGAVAADPRVDALRAKMVVREEPRFTREYLDSDKRSIGNAVQAFFRDGGATDLVSIDYPIGHRRRRAEGLPVLAAKFERNIATQLPPDHCAQLIETCRDQQRLERMPVGDFMAMLVK